MANVRWQQSSSSSSSRRNTIIRRSAYAFVVVLALLLTPQSIDASANSVFKVLVIGTSTQSVTSSTLAWEKFTGAEAHLQYAVPSYKPEPRSKESLEGEVSHGKHQQSRTINRTNIMFHQQQLHTPSYICRVEIEGTYTAGQTVTEQAADGSRKTICIVAPQESEIRRHHAHEILINMGGGGKLKWQRWNRYHAAGIFGGAVSVGTGKVRCAF